jgi:hypothetical protein
MPTNNSVNVSTAGILNYNGAGTFSANTTTSACPLIGGASNAFTNLGPLTDGQIVIGKTGDNPLAGLITVGAGVSIVNAAGSKTIATPNFVKLATLSALNSATIDFTSLISATYKTYAVILDNLKTTAGSTLQLLLSSNNGASWVVTNYRSGNWYWSYNNAAIGNQNSTTEFQLFTGASGNYSTTGRIFLYSLGYSAQPHIEGDFFVEAVYWQKSTGIQTASATYNAIRFQIAGGSTMDSGNFTLYGIS